MEQGLLFNRSNTQFSFERGIKMKRWLKIIPVSMLAGLIAVSVFANKCHCSFHGYFGVGQNLAQLFTLAILIILSSCIFLVKVYSEYSYQNLEPARFSNCEDTSRNIYKQIGIGNNFCGWSAMRRSSVSQKMYTS